MRLRCSGAGIVAKQAQQAGAISLWPQRHRLTQACEAGGLLFDGGSLQLPAQRAQHGAANGREAGVSTRRGACQELGAAEGLEDDKKRLTKQCTRSPFAMARVIPTQPLAPPSAASSRRGQVTQPQAALQSLVGPTRAALLTSLAAAAQRDFFPTVAPIVAALATPWPEPQLRDTVPPGQLFDSDSQATHLVGIHVHYKLRRAASCGSDDTLVLCLHGFNGSTYSFEAALQGLADAVGGTAAAFDRPPFGLTQRDVTTLSDGRSIFSTEGGAALGVALVQHLSARSVVLVGHSAGAGVALKIADMLPRGTVQGIVLVAPAVPASGDDGFMAKADLGSLLRIGATRAVLALDGPGLAFVRDSVAKRAADVKATRRIGYAGNKPAPQAAVDAYLAPLRADAWDTASLASFRAFATPQPLDVKRLAGVRVLVLQGALDGVVPTPSVRRLADVVQAGGVDCTYTELPDVGHLPLEEAPDACVAAISEWLKAALPPTPASGSDPASTVRPARWSAGDAEPATVAR